MSAICIIDTSVFCELLAVPMMHDNQTAFLTAIAEKISAGETLLVPMATILETGNHIGQNGDGRQRRQTAARFVDQVKKALKGETPFTPTGLFEQATLGSLLDQFPDWAGQEIGLGDLTIKDEWERQMERYPHRRVYIWSLDNHLASYDHIP